MMEETICLGMTGPIGLTNFEQCIICQKDTQTTLLRVRSVTACVAIEKRQYKIAKRLETDLVPDILEHKSVMWHGECRCLYSAEEL